MRGLQVLRSMRWRPSNELLNSDASWNLHVDLYKADVCLSQVIKLFCLLRKIRKISTLSLPLSITSFLFYLRSHLLSLTLILDRVSGAKKTGHKSVARWELRRGECFRLYPPAHHHSQYKYISQNGPFVFLCICRVAPVFDRRQFRARSEWVR